MQPGKKDFKIWKGGTFNRVLTFHDGDSEDDPLLPLTAYTTAVMDVKSKKDGTVLFTLSTANGRITLGGAAGTITLTITDEDTAALTFERAVYDLVLTTAGGVADPYLYGQILVDGV